MGNSAASHSPKVLSSHSNLQINYNNSPLPGKLTDYPSSLSCPPRSLVHVTTRSNSSHKSNSLSKTPIPAEFKYQYPEKIQTHKKQNSIDVTKKRFRLFSKTEQKPKCPKKNKGNGVTDICVSRRIAQNLCIFWKLHVDPLCEDTQLEIAVNIYFTMLEQCDTDFKKMMMQKKVKLVAIKFLEMIRWLTHALNDDEIDLHDILCQLGKLHKTKVIKLQYFEAYLSALHQTFSEYFPNKYKIVTKYCLDKIFVTCTTIMTGQSPINEMSKSRSKSSKSIPSKPPVKSTRSASWIGISGLSEWHNSRCLKSSDIWLKNLDECLKSPIGKEYFFSFLEQNFCYEIAIFLTLHSEFKQSMTETERFMCARKIAKTCLDIDNTSPFPINISYDTKMNFIRSMKLLEDEWKMQRKSVVAPHIIKITEPIASSPVSPIYFSDIDIESTEPLQVSTPSSTFKVPSDLLYSMLREMKRLIQTNHWNSFCLQIRAMGDSNSTSLELIT